MAGSSRVAVIFYSAMGHTYTVARAVAEGARAAGAEVRLRKVHELAPQQAIDSNPMWKANAEATKEVPEAALDDLDWATGYVFGSPTRYGVMAAQLKQFLDMAGPLWAQGKLADKPVAAFTGAMNPHGGQETTLHTIYNVMHHWGAVIVPPGYTDPAIYAAGGNPYGVSHTAASREKMDVAIEVLNAARYMGGRVARYAGVLSANMENLRARDLASVN